MPFKYGLKAARRAPQFSKRWSRAEIIKKPWNLNGFRVFSCPEIFDGFSWPFRVFDRFFIVNEGLTAVFRAFIVNKWAKWRRAKSAFSWIEGRHVSSSISGFYPLSWLLSRLRFETGPFGRIWPIQTFLIRFYPNLRHSADSSFCRASIPFQKKSLHT